MWGLRGVQLTTCRRHLVWQGGGSARTATGVERERGGMRGPLRRKMHADVLEWALFLDNHEASCAATGQLSPHGSGGEVCQPLAWGLSSASSVHAGNHVCVLLGRQGALPGGFCPGWKARPVQDVGASFNGSLQLRGGGPRCCGEHQQLSEQPAWYLAGTIFASTRIGIPRGH